MRQVVELQANNGEGAWLKELERFFEKHQNDAEFVPTYGKDTKERCVAKLLSEVLQDFTKWSPSVVAISLKVLRILMRERIGIEKLLTISAMYTFIKIAESDFSDTKSNPSIMTAQCEALKCAVNSVYDRPDFVKAFCSEEHPNGFSKIVQLLALPRSATFASLVVKVLVFATGEAPETMGQTLMTPSCHLLPTVVPTLAYAIRHDKVKFPTGSGRSELVNEILKLLFALGTTTTTSQNNTDTSSSESLTQLGVLLCEMLFLPNKPQEIFETKMLVINTLMYMPSDFGRFLVSHNALSPLLTLLDLQSDMVLSEKTRLPQEVTPLVVVLKNLITENIDAKKQIKEFIFPPEEDAKLKISREEQQARDMERLRLAGESEEELLLIKNEVRDRALHPESAVNGTLRAKLMKFMTSIEPTIKRYTSEFLFTLCDEDPQEFSRRTGMGNAIAMLRIKGLA